MRSILIGILLLWSSTATAQDMVGKPPEPEPALTSAEENPEEVVPDAIELDELGEVPPPVGAIAEPEKPSADESAARDLLDAAREAVDGGQYDLALRHIGALLKKYPDDPAAEEGQELQAWIENERQMKKRRARRKGGRTELILGQSLHGLATGIEVVWTNAGDSSPGVVLGVPVAGALLGGALATAVTPNGMEPGHAAAINLGTIAGGVLTWTSLKTNYEIGTGLRVLLTPVGQGLGTGLGALAYALLEPTSGQVSMTTSGGVWGALISTGVYAAARGENWPPRNRVLAGLHFLSATGGMAGGALLAIYHPMPRGRVRLIDVGGAVGALVGLVGLAAVTAFAEVDPTPPQVWGAGTLGAMAGLGLVAYWTRGYTQKHALLDTDLTVGVAPTSEGSPTLTLGGRF